MRRIHVLGLAGALLGLSLDSPARAEKPTGEFAGLAQVQYEGRDRGRGQVESVPVVDTERVVQGDPNLVRLRRIWAHLDAMPARWFGAEAEAEMTPAGVGLHPTLRFVEPWTGDRLRIAVGDVSIPFGREVNLEPPDRTFLDRSLASMVLFPRSRDYGVLAGGSMRFGEISPFFWLGTLTTATVAHELDPYYRLGLSTRAGVSIAGITLGGSYWRANRTFRVLNAMADGPRIAELGTVAEWRAGADLGLRLRVAETIQIALASEYTEARSGVIDPNLRAVRLRTWTSSVLQEAWARVRTGVRFERLWVLHGATTWAFSGLVGARILDGITVLVEYSHAAPTPEQPLPSLAADAIVVRIEGALSTRF